MTDSEKQELSKILSEAKQKREESVKALHRREQEIELMREGAKTRPLSAHIVEIAEADLDRAKRDLEFGNLLVGLMEKIKP